MKNRWIGMVGLSVVALMAGVAGAVGANMLTNGGFEIQGSGGTNDPAGWFRTHTEFVERIADSNPPQYGDYVLRRQDSMDNYHWASQKVAITGGVEYVASADFKCFYRGAAGEEKVLIYMEWHDSGGAYLGNAFTEYKNDDPEYADWKWVHRSVTATAPTNAVEVEVRVESLADGNGDSSIIGDNVVLTTPPPNLLANPSFETEGPGGPEDPDGWNRSSADFVKRSSVDSVWTLNLDDSPDWPLWADQTFSATPGDEFTASARFKAFFNAGESVSVDLIWLDSGGAGIGTNSAVYAQSDGDYANWAWTPRSVTAMAPVGTAQVVYRITSHLAGGSDSALWADDAGLRFLGANPMVPATILGWTAVSNGVMEMVVDAPGFAALYHPEAIADLVVGSWTNVPHSATAGGPYVVTNLSYSSTDATGTNEVIYLQTPADKEFFNIVGPQ